MQAGYNWFAHIWGSSYPAEVISETPFEANVLPACSEMFSKEAASYI